MTVRTTLALALIATTVALSACANTVRGAGKDISRTGAAVQRSVN